MELTVVLPAFNEAATIARAVAGVEAALAGKAEGFEIVVVDDGSRDSTGDAVRPLIEAGRARLVRHERNLGKGQALLSGFAAARGAAVGFLDADLEIAPGYLPLLLERIRAGAGVAVGSKHCPGARVRRPPVRNALSAVFRLAVRLGFGLRVSDTQTGVKIFRREFAALALARARSRGYAFDVEALALAAAAGARIAEVPVSVGYRRGPGGLTLAGGLRAARELWGVWRRLRGGYLFTAPPRERCPRAKPRAKPKPNGPRS